MNKFINNINKKLTLCQKFTLNNTKVIHPFRRSLLNSLFFTKINLCHLRQNPNNFLNTLLKTFQIDKQCTTTSPIQQIILRKQQYLKV